MTDQPSPEKVVSFESAAAGRSPDNEDTTGNVDVISDWQFIRDVEQLKALRSFLIQQAVSAKSEGPMYFGRLNTLRWAPTGRHPTDEDWKLLEEHTYELYRDLDDSVRRRFLYGQIPGWVTQTAVGLGIVALVALVGAVGLFRIFLGFAPVTTVVPGSVPTLVGSAVPTLALYMIWLAALGAIGSISFIGMNALAVQTDVTFDMTNTRLIVMRIVLGALFGIVLTLPFGFRSFITFLSDLNSVNEKISSVSSSGVAQQSILLLLPFILGFSTSLVIMILNQFVEAVQLFFGKKAGAPVAQSAGSLPVTKPGSTVSAITRT